MTSREKFRHGFNVFLSIFTGVLGFAYILSAANIYYSGPVQDGADLIYYSREIVWMYLRWLLIPTAVWIAAIIASWVISIKIPFKAKGKKQDALRTSERLKKRLPARAEGELAECLQRVDRRERIRFAIRLAVSVFGVVAAVMCGIYVFRASNFPAEDLNGEVLRMLAHVLPWICVSFVLTLGVLIYDHVSAKRVLPDIKRLVASKGEPQKPCAFIKAAEKAEKTVFTGWGLLALRLVVAAVGIVFVSVGIANGGAEDVLVKAINICTECIGLG